MNLREILSRPEALRFGWTLVHFLWQGAALALLLGLLLILLRRRSAGVRYVSACVVFLLMALAPVATYGYLAATAPEPLPEFAVPELDLPEPSGGGSALVAPPETAPAAIVPVEVAGMTEPGLPAEPTPPWHARALKWIDARVHWVVAGWFVGVLLLSMRLLIGWLRVRALKRSGRPAGDQLRARVAGIARDIGLSRPVRLLGSAVAKTPVVIGWLRPVILMPASLISGLSPSQLDAILAHELAHIRRYDYIVNLAQTVVETLLFYHPAVHWVSHRIRVEREHCCDDLAVSVTGDSDAYARTLVHVAALHVRAPRLVPAAGGHLFKRIRRLLLPDAQPPRRMRGKMLPRMCRPNRRPTTRSSRRSGRRWTGCGCRRRRRRRRSAICGRPRRRRRTDWLTCSAPINCCCRTSRSSPNRPAPRRATSRTPATRPASSGTPAGTSRC